MKTKGLLTSIMAPEASVKVGEMSSKSRLQINSKKKKKKFPVFSRLPNKGTKKKRERRDGLQAELAGRLIEFEIQIQIQLGGQLLVLNLTAAIHLI